MARKVAERKESVRNVLTSSLGRRVSMASRCTGTYTERAGGRLLRKKAGRLCRHCEPGWRTQHMVLEGSSEPPRLRSSKMERLCAVYLTSSTFNCTTKKR